MKNIKEIKIDCNKTLEFAKKILSIPSPTGFTNNAIEFLKEESSKRNLDYEVLNNSNLVITMKGKNDYTTSFGAHVDTLGAMVRSINSNGTLRFSILGGPILPTYDGEYCYILTRDGKRFSGTFLSNSPAAHVQKDAKTLPRVEETMNVRIDEIVKNKADVLSLGINTGDFVVVDPKTEITSSGFIKSRFLDDKISVAILFSLIDYIIDTHLELEHNLKFIFSTHEEMGFGSSFIPKTDDFIAVDMGCIGEDLACTEYDVSICVKDSAGPYNFNLTNDLINIAKNNNLSYAIDVYPQYSSDVSAALKAGNNIRGALIGPGVHASHGMERTHIKGIENTLKLLIMYLTK